MPPFQLFFFFWYKKIELCKRKIRVQTPKKIGCSECLCCMLQLKIPLCIEFRISQGSGLSLIWKGQISRAVFTGGKVQIRFTKAQKVSFVPLWMCWVERLALIQNCTSLVQVKTVCGAHFKKKLKKKMSCSSGRNLNYKSQTRTSALSHVWGPVVLLVQSSDKYWSHSQHSQQTLDTFLLLARWKKNQMDTRTEDMFGRGSWK